MALMSGQELRAQLEGFSRLPAFRQVGLLVGLAASVAIGVAIVLWAREPHYGVLFSSLPATEVGRVADALDKAGIAYRFDGATGMVMVPHREMHAARIRLATQGLPKSNEPSLEFLGNNSGLGTSRLIETARYHRAIEGELSRSITTLSAVESARVHLAIPKQSVFVRNRTKPSASVLLTLRPGRNLSDDQIDGIVHLVASSVPELETDQVTVVDQRGSLLTAGQASPDAMLRDERFRFARRIEETYVKRIHALLAPIVGDDGVRAEVSADVDFAIVETTSETYGPDASKIRSEQITGDKRYLDDPSESSAPESMSRLVRKYELDRTISHTRAAPGIIRRLSVAVVVDYREQLDGQGHVERVPLSSEELNRLEVLVREAVGFDATRGDSVNVMNMSFKEPGQRDIPPATPVWKEAWLWDVAKQVAGALAVVMLLLFVLRPTLRSLAEKERMAFPTAEPALPGNEPTGQGPLGEERLSLSNRVVGAAAQNAEIYEQRLDSAKTLVQEDPKRAAQVIRTWVATDE